MATRCTSILQHCCVSFSYTVAYTGILQRYCASSPTQSAADLADQAGKDKEGLKADARDVRWGP